MSDPKAVETLTVEGLAKRITDMPDDIDGCEHGCTYISDCYECVLDMLRAFKRQKLRTGFLNGVNWGMGYDYITYAAAEAHAKYLWPDDPPESEER